jgi:uncharacterized membrane protein YgdD (TMEM256/DUF423 family)
MHKLFLGLGSSLAALGVILGAFGAHKLKQLVSPETVNTFQTGVQYQMYHAFALLIVGLLYEKYQSNLLNYAGVFFIIGIMLFSGSLYLLSSLKVMNKVGLSGIGLITPIGGLMFILAWALLLIAILKK